MEILNVKSGDIILLKGDMLTLKIQKDQIEKALAEQGITGVKCIPLDKCTNIDVIRKGLL